MFLRLLRLRLKRELEELKALHRIEIKEKESLLAIKDKEMQAALERQKRELEANAELKLRETTSLLKLRADQELAQAQFNNQKAIDKIKLEASEWNAKVKEELLETHYKKLSEAMTKLHEEGNLTTRFTQDLALKMFESAPTSKIQTKVITSGE